VTSETGSFSHVTSQMSIADNYPLIALSAIVLFFQRP